MGRFLLFKEGIYLRLMQKFGDATKVHFVGRVEHDALPLWINAMDIVVQPSIGDESFGIAVLEAMSCGRPVVATLSGGISEVLQEGEGGFIVPKYDERLLAEKIITLLKDKDLATKMGIMARQRVITGEFTWKKVVSRLIEVYERVLYDNPHKYRDTSHIFHYSLT